MVILTTSSQLLSPVSLAASDSQVNLTLTSESLLSTLSHSPVSTSLWLVLPHLPPAVHNNTVPWPSQSSPPKCSMPRTWCAPPTHVTDVTSLPQLCSAAVCQQRKLTNKCSTFKTRTPATSLNGSPTTLSQAFVISHQKVLRCQLLSLVTQLPSKRCSSVLVNNSLLCSAERLSSIGTLVRVWTRWNSLKLNQTWTTSFLSTNNTKMPPLKMKKKWTRKRWNEHK